MNRYRAIAWALELRAGPGTGYEILEQLPHGEALQQVPPDPHWTWSATPRAPASASSRRAPS